MLTFTQSLPRLGVRQGLPDVLAAWHKISVFRAYLLGLEAENHQQSFPHVQRAHMEQAARGTAAL